MAPRLTGDTSLAGARTSALRGLFTGFVRSTALSPTERGLLVQRTAEMQPLSDAEREIATSFIAPMLNEKYPSVPLGEIRATALDAVDRLTKRDLATLITAVKLKNSGDLARASQQRAATGADPDRVSLDALDDEEGRLIDEVQTAWTASPPKKERREYVRGRIDAIRKSRSEILRRRGVKLADPTVTPAVPPAARGATDPNRAAGHGF